MLQISAAWGLFLSKALPESSGMPDFPCFLKREKNKKKKGKKREKRKRGEEKGVDPEEWHSEPYRFNKSVILKMVTHEDKPADQAEA